MDPLQLFTGIQTRSAPSPPSPTEGQSQGSPMARMALVVPPVMLALSFGFVQALSSGSNASGLEAVSASIGGALLLGGALILASVVAIASSLASFIRQERLRGLSLITALPATIPAIYIIMQFLS